jgi:hypothetical protein
MVWLFYQQYSRGLSAKQLNGCQKGPWEAYNFQLKNIIKIYNEAGFKVSTLSCDRENIQLINEIQEEFSISPNYPSSHEHVTEAERKNRVMKEMLRAVFHSLPFKVIAKIMIKGLAME